MTRDAVIVIVVVIVGAALVAAACGGAEQSAQRPAQRPAQSATPAGGAAPDHHEHGHHHHHGAQPLGHRFGEADRWVKVFDDPARDAWQKPDAVVAALELRPGLVVADIGAGTGYFESRLSATVGPSGKVIAVDVEPDMVRYLGERIAREKLANVEARLGTPTDPALASESVDRILIVDTWHHIPDRVAYVKKLFAALRPGGSVLVVDYTMQTSKGPPRSHRLEPKVVWDELEDGGLIPENVDAGLPDQYVIRAERPRLTL